MRGAHPNRALKRTSFAPGELVPSDPYRFTLEHELVAELRTMTKGERDAMMHAALKQRIAEK